jgi:hypothetical protein
MPRGRRERGCAAARVADEMEPLPAARVGLPHHAGDLVVEAVVARWLVAGVELEILRDGLDLVIERVDEGAVGEVGRQDAARKQDHPVHGFSFGSSPSSMKASTAGCAGLMR